MSSMYKLGPAKPLVHSFFFFFFRLDAIVTQCCVSGRTKECHAHCEPGEKADLKKQIK